jgi:putative glutamine amidotransferase
MTRPVIGIAGYLDRVRWDIWDTQATVLQQGYVDGVTRGGGRAVILPPDETDADIVDRLDGLLLPAGPDLDPALYGQPRHPAAEEPQPVRDAAELALLRAARSRGLPVLGVCRGMQLLVVAAGGTLHQHLPEVLGEDRHCERVGTMSHHGLRTVPGSLADRVLGRERTVNSHHHQGAATTGTLRATGFADDGTIEAVEDEDATFVLGVQWHPELDGESGLFAALVAAARGAEVPV